MDTRGDDVKDTLEADDEEHAMRAIRKMGYFVTKIKEVSMEEEIADVEVEPSEEEIAESPPQMRRGRKRPRRERGPYNVVVVALLFLFALAAVGCAWTVSQLGTETTFLERFFWIAMTVATLWIVCCLSFFTIERARAYRNRKKNINAYRFEGINPGGKEVEGVVYAESKEKGKRALEEDGYSVAAIEFTLDNPEIASPASPAPVTSRARRIALAAAKAFLVAIASALGAKFGGWLGGVIATSVAATFVFAIGDGQSNGSSNSAE